VPIEKHYHGILHYERIAEAESKFEAMHGIWKLNNFDKLSVELVQKAICASQQRFAIGLIES
jgi:hypothetical protein